MVSSPAAFFYLEPAKYKQVAKMLTESRAEREEYLAKVLDVLKDEMEKLAECLRNGTDPAAVPELEKHAEWAEELRKRYPDLAGNDVEEILRQEIGAVFVRVLEDAGVYKCTPEGREAFLRFAGAL